MADASQLISGRYALFVAGGIAVLAAALAYVGLAGPERRLNQTWQPVRVVVASRLINKGEVLQRDDLAVDEVPRRFLLGSHIEAADFENAHVVGQRVTIDFHAGDPIMLNFIESTAERSLGFSSLVTEKARAVSIRVSPESSVTNWIRPGDRVDILATFRDPNNGSENLTATLLENIMVLATGTLTGRDSFVPQSQRNYATVTVQVLPEAAEILVLAQNLGTLYLTLRNPNDDALQDQRNIGTNFKTIINGERARILNKVQNKIQYQNIEIIRGGRSIESARFPDGSKK